MRKPVRWALALAAAGWVANSYMSVGRWWRAAAGEQSGACRIKGNISMDEERMYHVPGQPYYNATRIDTSRGERWFCFEAQARAAGWRRGRGY